VKRNGRIAIGFAFIVLGLWGSSVAADLTTVEQLGKEIYFDNISNPPSMACATCHATRSGFTGPIAGINAHGAVYRGAVPQRFGNRKPPSAAYATQSPIFHFDEEEGLFIGGNFWDGRATGMALGNPAADQARGPFLNPVEQNMPDREAVCEHVAGSRYAGLFEEAWGVGALDCSSSGIELTYNRIALSIAAFEASSEVNQFDSKFDRWLDGEAELTEQEAMGMELFNGKALCAACHVSVAENGQKPLFTDYSFDNLGVPRNPENPFYEMDEVLLDDGSPINPLGRDWIDPGLGGFLQNQTINPAWVGMATENMGKHKVPTVRNVGKGPGRGFPKAYMHNGYFKSLKAVVHFYNTRDVKPECPDPFTLEKDALSMGCWPEPEVGANVNTDELGDLELTDEEEDAIVAFMLTLSDVSDRGGTRSALRQESDRALDSATQRILVLGARH
jgi:cytochrome c peroxidase